jgi:hypothetical protein
MLGFEASSTRVSDSLGVCGGTDYIQHEVRLGKHGDVAAVELMRVRFHTFRDEAFQVGVNSAVVLAHDVPARLRSPRGSFKLLVEEVRVWRALGRPNKFLFLLWQSPAKMPSLRLAQVIVKKLPSSPVRFGCRRGVVVSAGVAREGVIASRITIDLHIRLV